ncbi:right-handed parallel beta-helix repeat-containing protein [Pengzhenrongella sicca]|uniref:Right-handed parallel beta-helix repeat-containing protein n=1 Tax=Pengzhenrongella sicca TaxID=2819238 RepID=A0A8A4ZEX7_9MICO|nr:right-handed parallel beta-helix repeat-containing protein [Pengzhenrongella sicca]QTE29047.1 right-handed parallel beta-helix repeat-containing protein [Pengzhenrongella sicca]
MSARRVRPARGLAAAALVGASLVAAAVAGAGPAQASDLDLADPEGSGVATEYPGNPRTEPSLVADEEERLSQVRTVASMIRWRGLDVDGSYRLSTGSTYTLVLTKRDAPYGVAELLALAPQTFVRDLDGAYLLSENIVIQPGAVLDLGSAGPLEIRMASDAARFVSIVNLGGELNLRGTSAAPVTVTSWDRDAGAPDLKTDDGRAYVRSVGGRVDLAGVTFSDLGFWSGRTGGVALTGSDLPSAGVLDKFGRELKDAVDTKDSAADTAVDGAAAGAAGEVPDTTGTAADRRRAAAAEAKAAEATATAGGIDALLPAGVLPVPEADLEDPEYSYVSAKIADTVFSRNAFGLFVSSANGINIATSTIEDSLIDGLVMHRFVVNASVAQTVSRGNAGDGIILARATTGIMLSEVQSLDNGGSGIVVRGEPLADGPNATGMPVGDYGNNTIANSVANDNLRYGIEIVGGRNINVNGNDVNRNSMGIVVRDGAREVTLVGNQLEANAVHGIAIRDGVTESTASGNVVTGGPDGVYLRDSSAVIERNTLSALTSHAITLVGLVPATSVTENTLSGRGPSVIDRKRSDGAVVEGNDSDGWESTKPFWTMVRNGLQPLTVMWILLALLVVGTAVKGSRRRSDRLHPYLAQRTMGEIVAAPVEVVRVRELDLSVAAGGGSGNGSGGGGGGVLVGPPRHAADRDGRVAP